MKNLKVNDKGWTKINGNLPEVISLKIGEELVGKLISSVQIEKPFHSVLYNIESPTRGLVCIWGTSNLDPKMERVKKGQYVKIVFKGLKKLKGRDKPMKLFDVYTK